MDKDKILKRLTKLGSVLVKYVKLSDGQLLFTDTQSHVQLVPDGTKAISAGYFRASEGMYPFEYRACCFDRSMTLNLYPDEEDFKLICDYLGLKNVENLEY